MPPRTAPPFRADHVGSLLRTRSLKEARARHEKGGVSAVELKAIEDREIAAAIKKQEEIGLRAVTDGEFRRAFWNYDFLGALPGVEAYLGERKIKFQGVNPKPMMLRVTGKLGTLTAHPMLDHFKFVREHAKATPKMTIPSRAGGFEPLRFVPKGKTVVLGLVTSKSGRLELRDELKRRVDEAAKYVPLEQLCLSPQCGFASTEEGNILSENEQWAKLAMIVELAEEIWG